MMNPEQIRDLMDEVVKNPDAHIEFRVLGSDDTWHRLIPEGVQFSWNFSKYDYRIKPKPRVIYVNEYEGGGFGNVWRSAEDARHSDIDSIAARTAIKFIEVIED